jgi:hypothetical protein
VSATNLDVQIGGSDTVAVSNAGLTALNGAIAGTEVQVDVLSMPTTTVTATNLDVQIGGSDTVQVQSNSANLATETTAALILTSANFAAAFGTAGSADAQVMSVQGIAGGTALPVSGTVTVTDGAGALNVIVDSGSITANAGTNLNTSALLTTSAHDGAFGTAGSADTQVRTVQGIAGGTDIGVTCSNCSGTGVSADDGDNFQAADPMTPAGGVYQATPDTITDGDKAFIGVTSKRAVRTALENAAGTAAFGTAGTASTAVLSVQGIASMTPLDVDCVSGCAGGTADTDDASIATGQSTGIQLGLTQVYDGSVWRRLTIGTAGTASAQVFTVQGIASMTPLTVSATNLDVQIGGSDSLTIGTMPADATELPAAAAAAENMANPTAPFVLSANMCFDGSTWDRCPTSTGGAGAVDANTARVVTASDSPDVTALQILDDWDESDRAKVNLIAGQAGVAGGSGTNGATVQRVTVATDDEINDDLDDIRTAVQVIDDAQTGDSVHYRTSAGSTEDEHEIKATAGRLFSVAFTNTNAAVRYWRCANLTAANTTPGTSTVFIGLAIPGATTGAGFTHTFGPNGIAFSTALTCWFVTGAADSDVAEVAANEIKAIYSYK